MPSWPRLGQTRLLSNIRDNRRQIIEEAIRNTSRYDLWTTDEPKPLHHGVSDEGYFGLWISGNPDCSDFWAEVRRLEKTPYWQTYLQLSE